MQILSLKEVKQGRQSVLIYARPGMGKTTLCGMLPGKTLIVDVDRGTDVLIGLKRTDIDFVKLDENLKDLPELIDYLEKKCEYENVCIDSLSELEKSMLTILGRMGKNNGAPELGHYNQIQFKIADYVRRFRALSCNTLFTAWEQLNEMTAADGTKFQIARPALSGKCSDIICGLCNSVGRIGINNDNGERFVQLKATNYSVAKDRILKRDFCKFDEIFGGKNA